MLRLTLSIVTRPRLTLIGFAREGPVNEVHTSHITDSRLVTRVQIETRTCVIVRRPFASSMKILPWP